MPAVGATARPRARWWSGAGVPAGARSICASERRVEAEPGKSGRVTLTCRHDRPLRIAPAAARRRGPGDLPRRPSPGPCRRLSVTCRLRLGPVLGLDLVPLRLLRRGEDVAHLGPVLLVQRVRL